MQRNYSTFAMLRHAMLLSVFLEFSSNASGFYISLLIIPLTFNLVFLLHYVLSKISFEKMTPTKAKYLRIHTNQHTHTCLLILTTTMMAVSLLRMTTMQIQRSSYAGKIWLMQCGTAIWSTWQMGGQMTVMMTVMMIFLHSWWRVSEYFQQLVHVQ